MEEFSLWTVVPAAPLDWFVTDCKLFGTKRGALGLIPGVGVIGGLLKD